MNRAALCYLALGLAFGWLAGVAMSVSVQSRAEPQLELRLGKTKFNAREDGVWWQSQYETHNDLTSSSYKIGVSDLFPRQKGNTYRLGWRLAYTYLGKFSGNNHATIWDSDVGVPGDDSQCHIENDAHGCMARYRGHGEAEGVALGATLERNIGPLVVSVEGGPFYFRSSYDVLVTYPRGFNVFPAGSTRAYNHATGSHLTWYGGIRAAHKFFYVEILQYHNVYEQGRGPEGDVGLTGGRTRQILAGVTVRF